MDGLNHNQLINELASTMTSLSSQQQYCPALLLQDSATGSSSAAVGEKGSNQLIVQVHPLVLLHILDHHTRRQEEAGRVIGTLLGYRTYNATTGQTVVEVTNSFAVPHAERGDEVAIGKDFNKTMLQLHNRSNRKEMVVGWYATAASDPDAALISDTSSLIHEFYAGESEEGDPVHMVVDTRLSEANSNLTITSYKSLPVVIQGEPVGHLFHELALSIQSNESETIALHEMISQQNGSSLLGDNEGENGNKNAEQQSEGTESTASLQISMEKLHTLLETVCTYVDSVVDGKVSADAEMGRQIADTLATVPRIRPAQFDQIFHDSLQDLLMVTYLSNLTRTQLTIAEKLNASLGV